MHNRISDHQLNQIVKYISSKYETYAVQRKNGKTVFGLLENYSDLKIISRKTVIPFKKILLPNPTLDGNNRERKIAFIGLDNCDVWALHILYTELEQTSLLPPKNNILIFASECIPDKNCFCDLIGTNKIAPFDLFIQEEKTGYIIFSSSKEGKSILEKNGIRPSKDKKEIGQIKPKGIVLNKEEIFNAIDNKEKHKKFWEGVANQCFGCGACTAVCPLCFCFRQNFINNPTGESKQCLEWDSCFAKRFSEIQNHFDFRPKNLDRLYNWYHHKFVRSFSKSKHFLCTGCGRCIEACPANLNQKNIIESVVKLDKDES